MAYIREEVKKGIAELVEKYKRIVEEDRWGNYDEANTRRDFIEPLFHHLGWDVYNESKTDEVTEEERVSRGKVDYAFRISGVPKFFLEAKGIREDLDIPKWADQAINYSWHKGITWAVLSDFEGTKVFNAERIAKHPDESLFFELKWDQYLERFDQLWLLSKESIEKGELDKEAEKWLKKRRKAPVSQKMLSDFIQWRQKLTRSIRKHPRLNKISDEELNESVQRILDRLIFIRISEDRGMEKNHLLSTLREWKEKPKGKTLSQRLKEIFRDFDKGYNSKIFSPHISEDLVIDDEVLEEIINGLYETKDKIIRYDFSAVGADVLGNIYEQYLGHILKETPKRAKIVPSKIHRKERGIYYTPTYIVDYIVKNTLGELLKKTKPNKVHNIKVLDPACGSGSFLIRAFDEFVNYYQKHIPGEFGYLRKIEILKNNIYGVDLDRQAVEISQMNLLLKTLYSRQQLPMLKNIKQGNSLISGGEEELKPYFGDKWQEKCPFNWQEEFPEIFQQGGFNVIIGNPPYVRGRSLCGIEKKYLLDNMRYFSPNSDIYIAFLEKAFNLLKKGGILSFIIPRSFLDQTYAMLLRSHFIKDWKIKNIVDFSGVKVFEAAVIKNCILVIEKSYNAKNQINILKWQKKESTTFPQHYFLKTVENMIRIGLTNQEVDILNKIRDNRIQLKEICYVSYSVAAHSEVEGKKKDFYIFTEQRNKKCKRFIEAKEIGRYNINYKGRWLSYDPKIVRRPGLPELFENDKIVVRDVVGNKGIISSIDKSGLYADYSVVCLTTKNKLIPIKSRKMSFSKSEIELSKNYNLSYLLGLLNSKVLSFYFRKALGCELHVYPDSLRQLPTRKINFSNPKEKKMHDDLVKLVDKMLDLNKELSALGDKITDRRHQIESEIQKTDNKIDDLVYKLYGITNEEQKIIEEKA